MGVYTTGKRTTYRKPSTYPLYNIQYNTKDVTCTRKWCVSDLKMRGWRLYTVYSLCLVLVHHQEQSVAQTIDDAKGLLEELFVTNGYNKNIRPIYDQSYVLSKCTVINIWRLTKKMFWKHNLHIDEKMKISSIDFIVSVLVAKVILNVTLHGS